MRLPPPRDTPPLASPVTEYAALGVDRERITRTVLKATAATLGVFTVVFVALLAAGMFSPGDLGVVGVCDAFVAGLLILTGMGKWRVAGYALPAVFLMLATYLTYLAGLRSPAFCFFIVPIVLGFALLGRNAEWIILALSLLLYAAASWLHGDRALTDTISASLSVAAPYAGTVVLLRYARMQLRAALDASTDTAARLGEQIKVRHHAEEAMRDVAERSRAVFQSLEDGIILTDLQGRIVDLSPSAARMLSAPSTEALIGTQAMGFVHGEDSAGARAAILRVLAGRSQGIMQFRLRGLDGRIFEAQSTVVLYRDAAGEPAGTVSVFRDMTQRIAMEAQLQQSQKMQAVGRLAGGVAHDFNNLLLAIRGYAELGLQDLPAEHLVREYLAEVLRAADRASTLVRQLLAFSRSEAIRPGPMDLNQAVSGLAGMLSRIIGEQVALKLALSTGLPPVLCDPGQMEQVLVNLCLNARDAMPDGGEIAVQTSREELDSTFVGSNPWAREGEWVCLSVTDTGTGMPPEVLAHVFEPFFTTKGPGGGTGLGLATVYGIVKAHGGLLHCASAPGHGSSFFVYLPLSRAERSATAPAQDTGEVPRGRGETILVAEDEQVVRDLTVQILGSAGYRVIAAADGAEAVSQFRLHAAQIAVAVIDAIMPGLNGRAAVREMRQMRPELAVLFTTGYDFATLADVGSEQERSSIIRKPYAANELLRRVHEAIRERAPAADPPSPGV